MIPLKSFAGFGFVLLIQLLLLLSTRIERTGAVPPLITIGGLFSEDELEQQLIFHAVIEQINLDKTILPNTTLEAKVEIVERGNSFVVNTKACDLLRNGPIAIFGPFNDIGAMQVQSICENFEVPHVEAKLVFDFRPRTDLSINLYPHLTILTKVFMDLLETWEWNNFAVIYEENENVIHFSDFFPRAHEKNWDMKMFQLLPDQPYREVLWQVKETQVTNILLDVRTDHIVEFLRQAQQVGILSERHNYLVTSLDLHTLNLENFRHSRTNITSLRIVQEEHPDLKSLMADWQPFAARLFPRKFVPAPIFLKSESAMIYDGMRILARALQELNLFDVRDIDCNFGQPWQFGTTLINYIRQVKIEGITGLVEFDDSGFRSSLSFDIISTIETDFEVIGYWKAGEIIRTDNWKKHWATLQELDLIRVTAILNDPFVMNTKNSRELRGNDRYEGFVVDMLNEISKLLNVRFEINLVKDEKYGSIINTSTNEWNGLVGEVLRDEADIAVADLTINSNREQAVDFTYPFMSTGISIIYKKPTTKETSLWSFLSPFSITVWVYLIGAFAGISLILFYIGRFTPYEWSNPHPCHHHEPVLENACNMRNSFWCTIGSLMQQGSDVAPKALSTRVISSIWYFFTLILVSSYTANLAAFLTVEKVPFPFENVEELAQQTKVKYGCVRNGATHKFFTNSNISTFKKMAEFMEKNSDVLFSSNAHGREYVEKANGKYAFFMESATIEYITERYCNLTQVGGLLDNKGYGVATKKGSKFRAPLSETILKLQETGVLQQLKDRWWKQKGGGQCISAPAAPMTELGLRNLGGVFVVLVVGSFFAVLLGICEFLFKTRMSTLDKSTYKEDLWDDLKFVFSCYKPTKVVKRKSMKSLTGSCIFDNRIQSPTNNNNSAGGGSIPMTFNSGPVNTNNNNSNEIAGYL